MPRQTDQSSERIRRVYSYWFVRCSDLCSWSMQTDTKTRPHLPKTPTEGKNVDPQHSWTHSLPPEKSIWQELPIPTVRQPMPLQLTAVFLKSDRPSIEPNAGKCVRQARASRVPRCSVALLCMHDPVPQLGRSAGRGEDRASSSSGGVPERTIAVVDEFVVRYRGRHEMKPRVGFLVESGKARHSIIDCSVKLV